MQEEMNEIPLQNYKLSQIKYRQLEGSRMVAIQVGFANGARSPVFGTDSNDNSEL